MKGFFLRHPLLPPIVMLLLASFVGLALLAARIALSRHLRHLYLPWNLLLVWLPLGFALVVRHLEGRLPNGGGLSTSMMPVRLGWWA